jgi:hypothetical protein
MNQLSVAQAVERLTEAVNSHPLEQLILSQGTVYGNRYHTVEPIGGDWRKMSAWCGRVFGPGSTEIWQHDISKAPAPNLRWYMNNRKFWFRDEADLTLFLLKWQ